ncbi:DUF3048 domain-containing protein [Patescibacteria group bacterium]|nr:DUF3048 domain-containing protein [Patescibacteria group bacterium]
MQKTTVIFLGLALYLLCAGSSYAAFSYFRPGVPDATTTATTDKNGKFQVPEKKYANLPRTEACPLNGTLYPKPQRTEWEQRRPLGIMIENSKAARPQSGLSSADIVYEADAEGGISRFMAVFYCDSSEIVGPVRSARTYYLDWISEYGDFPLYAHVGGANTPGPADALGQIGRYGWEGYNDLNQFSIGFPTFWRDYDRLGPDTPTEHTVYASTSKLWNFAAAKRGLTNTETDDQTGKTTSWNTSFTPWTFKDDAALSDRPASGATVTFSLANIDTSYANDYTVAWKYDRDSNSYLRFNGGTEHRDMDTNQQILAKDVVLQFESLTVADDGYNEEGHGVHMLYGTKGSGKAKFLIDGKVTEGTWSKKSRTDRTKYFDNSGREIKFNRGQIWIETLPLGQQVTTS